MTCPLCGTAPVNREFPLDNDFELYRCASCAYRFVLRRPSIEELKSVYEPPPPGTFGVHEPHEIEEIGLIYHNLIANVGVPGKEVLEVGCNTGFILKGLNDLGYSVTGTDLSATALGVAKNTYHLDSMHLSEFPPEDKAGRFDVLIASHVIEHVLDPKQFVERCAHFVKKGGIFIIRTPNVDSIGIRIFKGHYPVFCPPIHLNYFSVDTLSAVLVPHFKVLRTVTHSDWNDPRNTVFSSLVAVSHLCGVKKKLKASPVLKEADSSGEAASNTLTKIRKATQITERALSPMLKIAGKLGAGENILMIARR